MNRRALLTGTVGAAAVTGGLVSAWHSRSGALPVDLAQFQGALGYSAQDLPKAICRRQASADVVFVAEDRAAAGYSLRNAWLVETASECVKAGQVCLAHCLSLFAAGDTSLAACAISVYEMNATCGALVHLAAAGSKHLPELAKLAQNICLECEKECRKHDQHYAECKACAEGCAACAEECKKASS